MVELEGIYLENERVGCLFGLDGNVKMFKLFNNGIYLVDDVDILCKKVMSMYIDLDYICVEDLGKIEGNMVFYYLDVFGCLEDV